HVRRGLPRSRGGRAADGAAGITGSSGPGDGSWCHAARVNLQTLTLQQVATVYCPRRVRLELWITPSAPPSGRSTSENSGLYTTADIFRTRSRPSIRTVHTRLMAV